MFSKTHPIPNISISFAPAWWSHHYGMVYDLEFWQDPIVRTERGREQQRLLYERFGDVGLGERDPSPHPVAGDAFGHRFMSAFWGCDIKYFMDQYPSAVVLPEGQEKMRRLSVPDVTSSQVVQQLYSEAILLREKYGFCETVINYGGPINNAVSVFGEEIYVACKIQPELAQSVLRKMGEAVLVIHELVVCPLNGVSGSEIYSQKFEIGNCPVGTISPRMYREVIRPVDSWLRSHFQGKFSLHHCGIFEPYAEDYLPLRPDILDVGPGTNLRETRNMYPDIPITTYLEVGGLAGITRDDLDRMVVKMRQDASPAELFPLIRIAEAGPEVSDDTVRELMTIKERIQ